MSRERKGRGNIVSQASVKNQLGRGSVRRPGKYHQGQLSRITEWNGVSDSWGTEDKNQRLGAQEFLQEKGVPLNVINAFEEHEGYSPVRIMTLFNAGKIVFHGGKLHNKRK